MIGARTIFLATDGRYVTFGSGDVPLAEQTIAGITAQNLAGWRVVLSGSPHMKRAPKLTKCEAVGGATDADWDAAVMAFLAGRRV